MLAAFLIAQRLHWSPFTDQVPAGIFAALDVALGLSILLVVFQEARARNQRLSVLRALTESIVLAQQQGGMMDKALEELGADQVPGSVVSAH